MRQLKWFEILTLLRASNLDLNTALMDKDRSYSEIFGRIDEINEYADMLKKLIHINS